jgi:hypothetical protein
MDNFQPGGCFRPMEQTPQKHTSPASLLVDAILIVAFFVFMYTVVSTHVPSEDPKMRLIWGAACSACLTGVFWLCVQMFRVVLKAQRQDRRK